MNYRFICDETQLRVFYETFQSKVCENVNVNDCSIKVMLQSRRKYNSQKQSQATVSVARRAFALHNDADAFVQWMKHFQVERGLYVDRADKDGNAAAFSDESMVLYVTSNALSRAQAMKTTVMNAVRDYLGVDLSQLNNTLPFPALDKQFMTQLHKEPCTKVQRIDVDTQDKDLLNVLDTVLIEQQADVLFVIKTKNGYHYTLRNGPVMRQLHQLCGEYGTDLLSLDKNGMNVIPGTLQAGTPVELIFAKGRAEYARLGSGKEMP